MGPSYLIFFFFHLLLFFLYLFSLHLFILFILFSLFIYFFTYKSFICFCLGMGGMENPQDRMVCCSRCLLDQNYFNKTNIKMVKNMISAQLTYNPVLFEQAERDNWSNLSQRVSILWYSTELKDICQGQSQHTKHNLLFFKKMLHSEVLFCSTEKQQTSVPVQSWVYRPNMKITGQGPVVQCKFRALPRQHDAASFLCHWCKVIWFW